MHTIFLFLFAIQASQAPLTLGQLETEALANNPEIRAAVAMTEVAESRVAGAAAFDDPELMYRNWGVPVFRPWSANQAQQMIMLSQKVPGSGKRALRYLTAHQEVEIQRMRVEAVRRDVVARVRLAFYRLQRNRMELLLHHDQIALAEQAVTAARIKYTVGRVPQQDILKAQMSMAKLVDHLVTLEREGDEARAQLNSLLGSDAGGPLDPAGERPAVPATLPDFAALRTAALQHRPELIAARLAIAQSETRTRLAERAYAPDFTISAGYMLMPPEAPARNTLMAEFSMSLPWLNRGRHDAEIREAHSEVRLLRAEYERQVNEVAREIRETLVAAESTRRLLVLYRNTLQPLAETTLKAAVAAYQTDRTDFLNLLDSQNASVEVGYAYQAALTEFESRLAELERLTGSPLPANRGGTPAVSIEGRQP